jgi:ABC-type nickel/cobalt efflux system permease component RcnA
MKLAFLARLQQVLQRDAGSEVVDNFAGASVAVAIVFDNLVSSVVFVLSASSLSSSHPLVPFPLSSFSFSFILLRGLSLAGIQFFRSCKLKNQTERGLLLKDRTQTLAHKHTHKHARKHARTHAHTHTHKDRQILRQALCRRSLHKVKMQNFSIPNGQADPKAL